MDGLMKIGRERWMENEEIDEGREEGMDGGIDGGTNNSEEEGGK